MSAATATQAAPLRVALLGCGTVGSAVAQTLVSRSQLYTHRVGRTIEVAGIAVRNPQAPRELDAGLRDLLTADASALVARADLVVELMGGIEPAQSLIHDALEQGKPVVTANKQLIAASGPQLVREAGEHGTSLDFEAAVAAALPVLRVVRESMAGDRISSINGILNGSTNFVLDMVARHGLGFADAVERAGELGYLEADPSEDLEGVDAAAKIVILARTAWDVDVGLDDVHAEGIAHLTDADFEAAASCGQVIKLLASAWASGDPARPHVEMAVRPVALGADDPLAQVREGRNAVVIEAESAGVVSMFGAGAGGPETASAVIGDLVNAARRLAQ